MRWLIIFFLSATLPDLAGGAELMKLHDLDWGAHNGETVRLQGALSDIKNHDGKTLASFSSAEGAFTALIDDKKANWENRLNGIYELEGTVESKSDRPAFFNGVKLLVNSPENILTIEEPPLDPFAVDRVNLKSIFSRSDSSRHDGRAVKTIGVVTFVETGKYFIIQDNDNALKISNPRWENLNVGDFVEVVGFPEAAKNLPKFHAIVYRTKQRNMPLPKPVTLRSDEKISLASRRVETIGRFDRIESADDFTVIRLVDNNQNFIYARFRTPSDPMDIPEFRWKPMIKISGVLSPDSSVTLILMNSTGHQITDDLSLIMDDEALAMKKDFYLSRITNFAIVIAFVLLCTLLGKVRRRQKLSSTIASERKRMADDLHDTIEQHLAGAGMLLKLARKKALQSEKSLEVPLREAQDILLRAKQEMRDVVWGLKMDEMMLMTPVAMLQKLAGQLSKPGQLRIRTRIRGLPKHFPAQTMRDLSLVVREAVNNAVKHGNATRIAIVVDPVGDDAFMIRIANNGKPFDRATAPGPADGHFGLEGMSERVRRMGMTLTFETRGKWTVAKLETKK